MNMLPLATISALLLAAGILALFASFRDAHLSVRFNYLAAFFILAGIGFAGCIDVMCLTYGAP